MSTVSAGQSVQLQIGVFDGLWVNCSGVGFVDFECKSRSTIQLTTQYQRIGFYGESICVELRCVSGVIDYSTSPVGFSPLTARQGGDGNDSSPLDIKLAVNKGLSISQPPAEITLPNELAGIKSFLNNGVISCSATPSSLWDTTSITSVIYVDSSRPSDAGNGLTWATAKQSIEAGIIAANALGVATRVVVRAGIYYRGISIGKDSAPKTLAVPMLIEAAYGRVISGTFDVLTWSKTGGQTNVYQATRSNTQIVTNPLIRDQNGDYLRYVSVASIAACDALPGSFFTDNVTLYVHTHDSSPANNNSARAYLNVAGADFKTAHNLLVRGIDFEGGNNAPFTCRDGSTNIVIMDNCTAKYGAVNPLSTIAGKDGVQVLGCKIFAAFDSQASSNGKDGFNIHEQSGVKPFGLTVRCKGFSNGIVPTSTSNNGITYHDGCQGVDIGGVWLGSIGANHGHIDNGTKVYAFGSIAGNSDGDVINGGTWDWGGFGVWSGDGKLWLENCTDVGSRIGVYSAGGATVYIRNHSGSGLRIGDVQSF